MPTAVDPTKLRALVALQQAGLTPREIQARLHISRRTWFRWNAELRRFRDAATRLDEASPNRRPAPIEAAS